MGPVVYGSRVVWIEGRVNRGVCGTGSVWGIWVQGCVGPGVCGVCGSRDVWDRKCVVPGVCASRSVWVQ